MNHTVVKAEIPDEAIGHFRKDLDNIADAFYVYPENLPLIKPLIE